MNVRLPVMLNQKNDPPNDHASFKYNITRRSFESALNSSVRNSKGRFRRRTVDRSVRDVRQVMPHCRTLPPRSRQPLNLSINQPPSALHAGRGEASDKARRIGRALIRKSQAINSAPKANTTSPGKRTHCVVL
jgi:hypothetical protein